MEIKKIRATRNATRVPIPRKATLRKGKRIPKKITILWIKKTSRRIQRNQRNRKTKAKRTRRIFNFLKQKANFNRRYAKNKA